MDIKIKGTIVGVVPVTNIHVDLSVEVPDNLIGAWLSAITKSGRAGSSRVMEPQQIIDSLRHPRALKGEF